jgi:hypothetical protein
MAKYAKIINEIIEDILELDSDWIESLRINNNPKLNCFRILVEEEMPELSANEIAEQITTVYSDRVVLSWNIRAKTPDELRQIWTSYEFLNRLTAEERADIRERSATDPNVADFLMLAQAAQEIVSDDPATVMGMNYMVYIGVFTEERKNQILNSI